MNALRSLLFSLRFLLPLLLLMPWSSRAQESQSTRDEQMEELLSEEQYELEDDFDETEKESATNCTSTGNIVYSYGTYGATFASRYYKQSGVCGSDSDYVFEFYPSWGGDNSFDIRWYDTWSYARSVLLSVYPNGLTHIGSTCSSPIKICIGQTALTAIGGWPSNGAAIVKSTLYIWHY